MSATRLPRILLSWCCLAASCAAAWGEIVVLDDGRYLKTESYEIRGDRVLLDLASGGRLEMPMLRVDRILADEIVTEEVRAAFHPPPFFLGFSDLHEPPDTPFGGAIFEVAKRHNINPALIAAIVRAESAFDPAAVSRKGARGLMQLMPATARRFGKAPEDLFDVELNLEAGVRYLDDLVTRYSDDLPLVLAAYNAGEGAVDRYHGVPPYRETLDYIRRIYSLLGIELASEDAPGK